MFGQVIAWSEKHRHPQFLDNSRSKFFCSKCLLRVVHLSIVSLLENVNSLEDVSALINWLRRRKTVATTGRSYGWPSEKFVGVLGRNFQKLFPELLRSCIYGGHLKPVTLKPVIHIFRIFRVSCPHFPRFPSFRPAESPQTLVFLGWEGRPHFPPFPCIRFESLISKIRPTGIRWLGIYVEIPRCNAFRGNFLEVCFRTPRTSQNLLQKSALRCIWLLSALPRRDFY